MPHDGHMHHHHEHVHPHTQEHVHPRDHNHAGPDHLHSHPINTGSGVVAHDDAVQDFIDSFIAGFRAADDKNGFLRLAKVPFEIKDQSGGPSLKLVDVAIEDAYQVATASPAFASDELVYHPYPGRMVRQRTDMKFVYVSLKGRRDIPLAEMAGRLIDA